MSVERSSAALGAAIRIALGAATLSACGGVVSPVEDPASRESESETRREGAPPALSTADATAEGGDAGVDAGAGCAEALAAAFPDGGPDWWSGGETSKDPFLVACCSALASEPTPSPLVRVRESGCCNVDFPGNGPACTPWGPPVPPAFLPVGVA